MTKKISNKQFAQALFEVTKDLKGEKMSEAIKKFVLLLARQHKLKRAEQIIAEYEKRVKKENGEVEIEIKSARKLEKTLIEKIGDVFSTQGRSASGGGKKVETKEEVDASLLGGIVVRTEDKIIDSSLRAQLMVLKRGMIN